MSTDYPDREHWLAKRARTVKPGRYLHVSGYGAKSRAAMPPGVPAGVTYDVGSNRRKRAARAAAKAKRARGCGTADSERAADEVLA